MAIGSYAAVMAVARLVFRLHPLFGLGVGLGTFAGLQLLADRPAHLQLRNAKDIMNVCAEMYS